MRTPLRTLTALSLAVPLVLAAAAPADAASKRRRIAADTAAPSVTIASPTSGSSVGSAVSIAGSASDNVGVAGVAIAVDGGAWQAVSGTTSWSAALSGLASGGHTVTARATDAAGNAGTASVSVTVATTSSPSPTPTTSPSPSPTPTTSPSPSPTASPSPTPTTSPSPSPSPTTTTSTGSAPDTQGSWTSPEGAVISVQTAGPWTIAQVYQLLLAASSGPGDFARVAPTVTVNVQDSYATAAVTSAAGTAGAYSNYRATIWLKGINSTFSTSPDFILTHEYGHAWTGYHYYLGHGGEWSTYLAKRWSSSQGALLLANDTRLGSAYSWDVMEIVADDYRLLFGNTASIASAPGHLNQQIVDPRQQPGLRDWFVSTWA